MEITVPPKPSIWYLLSVFIAFSAMGIASLYYAVIVCIDMVTELANQQEIITIKKGAFYLFGVGFTLFVLVGGPTYAKIFKRELSDSLHVLLMRLIVVGLVLTFALPQIIHYSVSTYLEDQGYQICKEKSRRWSHVVTIVYTKNTPCSKE